MNAPRLIARLSLLTLIVVVIGTATVAFARTSFAPLAPAETNNGTLTGAISGSVSPNARFTVSVTAVLSDEVTTYQTSTLVGPGAYTFTNLPAGDDLGFGYGSTVSYTVSAIPSAPCYSITPVSRTAEMTSTAIVTGMDFVATWVRPSVTVNVRMTEAVFVPGAIPSAPSIVPPARSNGIANLKNVIYLIQGPGVNQQSTLVGFDHGATTAYAYTNANANLMAVEPSDGNCSQVYTVSVYYLAPNYMNVVPWSYVPAGGVQTVTVSTSNPVVNVSFLAYHYWAWQPIVLK